MMDWTDRHCRFFHRVLSPHARLYTEMIPTGALLHGDAARHLDFHEDERPLALQLGGSEPDELARCARLGELRGYGEINLNCGCPSSRMQRGAFGACLMAEPARVADCVRAMRGAVSIPVTVKHRIGIDRGENYGFVHGFVRTLLEAGCTTFIVHARNAWLDGLSPKENRELPPLRHDVVRRLKGDFPDATIVLNGGLHDSQAALREIEHVDGVMLGRAAYHWPWTLVELDRALFGGSGVPAGRHEVVQMMSRYLEWTCAGGVPVRTVARAMLGLFQGCRGARTWRRLLSDPGFLALHGPRALLAAAAAVQGEGGVGDRTTARGDPAQDVPAARAG
jgi:tRNA-dihydrouridine synthase A